MFRLLRFVAIVAIGVVGSQLLSPCRLAAQPQQAPRTEGEPDQCFLVDNYIDCGLEECQYRCECDNSCPPETTVNDDHPSCCGTGVDCRCPGWPLYPDGHFNCTGGYSYCCCHDQCCAYYGLGTFWCAISWCTWLNCYGGCAQWGEYHEPPPDDCDYSGYPDPEPQECLSFDGYVDCGLEQCAYRCECQN